MSAGLPRLMLFLLMLLPAGIQAQFAYVTNNGAITITGYSGSGGELIIPDTIDGLPVTVIGGNAFRNTDLTKITIPNSVTSIEAEAFYECGAMTSLAIPDSVSIFVKKSSDSL
jgi:hypothetical protein